MQNVLSCTAPQSSIQSLDEKGTDVNTVSLREAYHEVCILSGACLQARGIQEREERVDHLNDTSFDRRRKVAVYKTDGKRGHHMQVHA